MKLGVLDKNICGECGTSLEPMKKHRRASAEFWRCPHCKKVWRVKSDPRQTHTTDDNREAKPL